MKSKLHFINGHRQGIQGAKGYETVDGHLLSVSEWEYASSLHEYLNPTHILCINDAYNLNQYKHMIGVHTIALEFHLNSFNSDVLGYEVLILENDYASRNIAEKFLELMEKTFPLRRNRGIKILTKNDRGYNNLLRLKKYYNRAILTEMFFLSNPEDWMTREDTASILNNFSISINL